MKGSTECPKGSVVVRHGVCPMLSVVAMGMLLIGRRADRRHGSRGATPTIARRPHPFCEPTATSRNPHPRYRSLSSRRARTRCNSPVCTFSSLICTRVSASVCDPYARIHLHTYAHLTVPRTPFDNPNSRVVQRRLPLIVPSGNVVGRNFLVCTALVGAGDYASHSHVCDIYSVCIVYIQEVHHALGVLSKRVGIS